MVGLRQIAQMFTTSAEASMESRLENRTKKFRNVAGALLLITFVGMLISACCKSKAGMGVFGGIGVPTTLLAFCKWRALKSNEKDRNMIASEFDIINMEDVPNKKVQQPVEAIVQRPVAPQPDEEGNELLDHLMGRVDLETALKQQAGDL